VIKSGFQLGKKADLDYSRRLTPLAAISLLCALTARPQTPNDPVFRVDVDVRQVDLVVTDAKGHHVTDLGPDDFRIFQDGRPQKMTNFSWIEVTPPPTGAQLAALQKPVSLWERFSGVPTIAKTPGNDIVAAQVVNPHKDEIRRTIAFVMNDDSVGVVNRIRKLIDEQLSPTDMVSIGSTLRSVVPLSHGMAEIRDSMGIFQQFSNDKRQLDAALERIPRTCDFLHTCITDELGAITSAIQSLRDVPGRKALVFVGGYRGSVDRVVDMANRAGVVVFVLNPAGTSMDASDNFPGSESIVQLAKHTGGTWLLATPGADLTTDLNLVMEDLSGYYLLGFHPDPSDPDDSPPARARHRVEVKVLGTRTKINLHSRIRRKRGGICRRGDGDKPSGQPCQSLKTRFVGFHLLPCKPHPLGVDGIDQCRGRMHTLIRHSLRHSQGLIYGLQRVAVPVVLQHAENAFDRVVFTVVRRVAGQFHRDLMFGAELDQPPDPLGAPGVVLRSVVRVDHEGMWRTIVFLSVGQMACRRSAMKSAVALPVVKLSHVSAVSGRWMAKGVSLATFSRS